jgi:uncharacterized protein
MIDIELKKQELENKLRSYGKVMVAFSGGVDSTFLLKIAGDTVGVDVTAVTVKSPVFPEWECSLAANFCANEGIGHKLVEVDLLSNKDFVYNQKDRCYVCKRFLFKHVRELAASMDIPYICEGSIVDDDNDYRPGKKAIKELGILSPMKEVGLTKQEIRFLSHKMGLTTWDKPSMACLASRIPYDSPITYSKLRMVEEAENYLFSLGFLQVRVRIHDNVARIEIGPSGFEKLLNEAIRDMVYSKLRDIGFSYVTLDLKGYRTGSLNEVVNVNIDHIKPMDI